MPNNVTRARRTKIDALTIGAQAAGVLAVGALAVGALAIGALAIGRLMIGRSRIQRLEINELVVGRLHVMENVMTASTATAGERKQAARFSRPTLFDRSINKSFGLLVGVGLGLRHNYLLQVRGRKSGRIYSTPINVLERGGKRYLVAARGYTQWVQNAVADGAVTLKKGRRSQEFGVRLLRDEEKPEILKSYLDRYRLTVQRYFLLPAGSPSQAFVPFTEDYPVFELMPPSGMPGRNSVSAVP
jgi:deazaflavin-dependent oxidoreductase (nitroreductase family)